MKKIFLSGKRGAGKFAKVDDSDFDELSAFKWHFDNGYAKRQIPVKERFSGKKWWYLHWSITGKPAQGFEVDHKNGDKLDNRRENLRVATLSQNRANIGLLSRNKSGFKGVSWHKASNRWGVRVKLHGKVRWVGVFKKKEDAAIAYNKKAKELFGEFAYQNPV